MIDGASRIGLTMSSAVSPPAKPAEAQKQFAAFFKEALNRVNEAQIQADALTEKLVRGENVQLHDVMIAAQKASITLQLTLEIRNKAIEAYQEMMRMPL
ncbi:flagellar hook-basal body complex protein FliE [Geobacillus sp. G4]|jgi:flagellar hook-basal body complex protein FliE|uniref:Flagellar hook-basal body complex protein FliE n=8 Tax=Geobacillus TaxID=129337 RepID=Q5L0M7_GEOKA|nr:MULTISPECIES: flagellar hook-basal body complex protein FliE [Geobacillus]ALA69167.1 flagellar hook-basal body protein FliE [Geobacillus stearothermophilus 10]ADU93591.1 flagellar hook-basal body complex subunit FliE [Geobacillus sp. Y412MC52]AEV18722.1 Flagellar hook-basal body complex subunit FliE [Geobacillus thermoleovorans CCB_US3_UF5]AGE21681.1 flagellar hook-basal body complex protein [Geobacillus sp. GHH01]AMV10449.1 flagellar hook-basal body protein FliE [Geobacillus thermoleovoran